MSSSNQRKKNNRSKRHIILKSLFSRMLVSYMAVTLCLMMAAGVTVMLICANISKASEEARMRRTIMRAGELLSLDETLRDSRNAVSESTATALDSLAAGMGYQLELVFADQAYVFQGNPLFLGVSTPAQAPETIMSDLGNGTITGNWFEGRLDVATVTIGTPIYSGDTLHAVLLLHGSQSSVADVISAMGLGIVLVILIGVFFCVLLVYYSTTRTMRPFMQINETVQRYSKGDFSERISLSDITEATQLARSFNAMADQLNDLEFTRRSFVSNVSHELRSPLTSMGGFLEAMHDGTIPEEDFQKYLEIVLSENKRMTTMVNDLLDLARIESGKTVMKPEVFEINELLRRILLTFEARIYERKMEVEVKFAQEQYYVEADNAQISQVVRNLIDNAIKYTQPGGKIRLASYAVRAQVFVSVQDSGIGIPDEDLPYVFDRFYKVEKAHTPTKQSGTGLGLSIVKKIIDQHGQTITVQSARGKGSTFTFTLKRVQPPKAKGTIIPEEGAKYGV